jgi:hypothetical protein
MLDDDQRLLTQVDTKVTALQNELHTVRAELEKYLSKAEWLPYQMLLMGVSGAVITAIVGYIFTKVAH